MAFDSIKTAASRGAVSGLPGHGVGRSRLELGGLDGRREYRI
jgi:hypothetical protein